MLNSPSALDHTPLYADPAPIIADALDELLPAERISISDYAAEHRYLNVTVRVPGDEEMVIRLLACSPEPIPPWRDSTD